MFVIFDLLKPINVPLMVKKIQIVLSGHIWGPHRRIPIFVVCSYWRRSSTVVIWLCSARKSGRLVRSRTVTLNGGFLNTSIVLLVVVFTWVLPYLTTGPIYTSHFLVVSTNTIHPDLGGIFVCFVTRFSRRACSSYVLVTCFSSLSLSMWFFGRSLMEFMGTGLGVNWAIIRHRGRRLPQPFRIDEVASSNDSTIVNIQCRKTTLTLESQCWHVTVSSQQYRPSACSRFSKMAGCSTVQISGRLPRGSLFGSLSWPAVVSLILLTGCVLCAIIPTNIITCSSFCEITRFLGFSKRHIWV